MKVVSFIAIGLALIAGGQLLGGKGGLALSCIGAFVALKPFFDRKK